MTDSEGDRPTTTPWPPILLVGTLALGFALQAVLPIRWLGGAAEQVLLWLGVAIIIAALATFAWTLASLRRHRTTFLVDRPSTALVTEGPFRYSRNPIYCGIVALIAGIGLAAGNAWLILLAPIAAVLLQRLAIEPEEEHLEARFGDAWRAYADTVRRWV